MEIVKTQDISAVSASPELTFPVDQLFFRPEMMDNSVGSVALNIEISLATMGQDQRHRTIHRGIPWFTREFYAPPVVCELGLSEDALALISEWTDLYLCEFGIPKSLGMIIAPYGAVVGYSKKCPINALVHEQGKRLCWCAQEEIYNVARKFREQLTGSPALEPHCFKTGVCAEGERYCGRDIIQREKGYYFPQRRV